jgi:hypothetical protein
MSDTVKELTLTFLFLLQCKASKIHGTASKLCIKLVKKLTVATVELMHNKNIKHTVRRFQNGRGT